MPTQSTWRQSSKWFFNERADQISTDINPANLCFVSGREQRLWTNPELYEDMMDSIQTQLELPADGHLLEVGCAAGFLAAGLAHRVAKYAGCDIAPKAIAVARNLGIANADFQVADGAQLPWPPETFDRTICYDVFTNFPDFADVANVLREMARVTRAGGKIMAGSIADDECREAFQEHVHKVVAELDQKYGANIPVEEKPTFLARVRGWFLRTFRHIEPQIVCYYLRRSDFERLGEELNLKTEFFDIHSKNPYCGYRFNVVYSK